MLEGAIREVSGGLLVQVDVRPGAPDTRIVGYREGRRAIRVDVATRPERGAANRALAAFFARLVGGEATVVRGAGSRRKTLLVRGVAREDLLAAIARGLP